jgi:hypothetical protein
VLFYLHKRTNLENTNASRRRKTRIEREPIGRTPRRCSTLSLITRIVPDAMSLNEQVRLRPGHFLAAAALNLRVSLHSPTRYVRHPRRDLSLDHLYSTFLEDARFIFSLVFLFSRGNKADIIF